MRHRKPLPKTGDTSRTGRTAASQPFAGLRSALRASPTPAPERAPPQAPAPPTAPLAPSAPSELREPGGPDATQALFLQAVAGSTRLVTEPRAELHRPPPPPTPRPPAAENRQGAQPNTQASAPPAPRPDAGDDPAGYFRACIGAVTPLPDPGRVLLGRAGRKPPGKTSASDPAHSAQNPTEVGFPAGLFGHQDTLATLPAELPATLSDPARLFAFAVGQTHALPDPRRAEIERPRPPPRPLQHTADASNAANARKAAELPQPALADRLETSEHAQHLRPGLPRRVLNDLRRGRWPVQAELDLHGMNRDAARLALGQFLQQASTQGWRCLRLIHGKGLSSPGREAVLKHLSRGWLLQHEEILAFCPTRPSDGGEGALLLLLKQQAGGTARPARGE